MMVVLHPDQEALLLQMAADLDMEPSLLLEHLLSDRLAHAGPNSLWTQ